MTTPDPREARRAALANGLREIATNPTPDEWFYLSFTDAAQPEGQQFLGGAYLRGGSLEAAITRSHILGVNPGGDVMVVGPVLTTDLDQAEIPAADRERLLSRCEIERHTGSDAGNAS